MWILLEHNSDTFEYGMECHTESFPRLDFRGVYSTHEEAFASIMAASTECRSFSLFNYEAINDYFSADHMVDNAQYKTNGDYVVDLTTGVIVYGDASVAEMFATIEELVAKITCNAGWICNGIYKTVTGKWYHSNEKPTVFAKPHIYNLTKAQLMLTAELLQAAVDKK